jgi:hypothetical protein
MKKAAFSVLVCLLACCFTKLNAQQITTNYGSNHPHRHLTSGVASILYDPHGTGRVVEDVSMSVNLDDPGIYIVSSSLSVSIETANDHWEMANLSGSSAFYAKTIEYNWNDEPYWIHYDFEVEYSDGTWEFETIDYYFW